ncbi:nuclease-related domain-containing protein [Cognatilysobacter terrigena]|uniref:nuclease-related domain-containing protein n=1 Tax=Cognatilysobacter terrigena TaxID=2488749 RepID=UPI00105E9DF5|nr:nuclease-related domain-containing protein [Lysobacter terrigena]
MKWQAFMGHFIFIGSLFITAAITLTIKWLSQRRQRRSPLYGKQIGHLPGQQLLERIDSESFEASFGVDVMIIAAPLLTLVWATMRINWGMVRLGVGELIFIAGWLGCLIFGAWKYQRHAKRRQQARDGLLAERVTGMQLNRLMSEGCLILHDLPFGSFNVDHVVVSPRGVFAIETKSFRKPKNISAGKPAVVAFDGSTLRFPDFATSAPLEQARRQAQSVAGFLRETLGEGVYVQPAVALPGWWIEKNQAGKAGDIFVFTPMGRGCEWFARGDETVSAAKRGLIAQALATKYPIASE